MQTNNAPAVQNQNFVAALASRVGMEPEKFYNTIKNTVFSGASDHECNALLMVAHEYGLNPLLKEIYAFKGQGGGIVPMIPIDGWLTMVNRNPMFAGYETHYPPEDQWVDRAGKKCPAWIEVVMIRKDMTKSFPHREYMDECYKDSGPWKSHPKRMLKHKAFIQSARFALGYSGIYDEDEARGFIEATVVTNNHVIESAPDTSEFDRLAVSHLDSPQFQTFLGECSKASSVSVESVKVEAAKDFDGFMAAFDSWSAKNTPKVKKEKDKPAAPVEPEVMPSEQAASTLDARETFPCPNLINEETGQMMNVLVSKCATCSQIDGCPSHKD
jgi:phage recombination protein Bet